MQNKMILYLLFYCLVEIVFVFICDLDRNMLDL